jgi:hypothetical protein
VIRYGRVFGTALVGALLAGAYVIGMFVATDPRPVGPEPERLRLEEYCRHLYGGRSDAYQPRELSGWRCSVWRNGVWGLEEVDLTEACRWQRGPDAQPMTGEGRSTAEGLRLVCAI